MKLEKPIIVVNTKAYIESVGKKGLELAKICEEVSKERSISIAICPQQVSLAWIASSIDIPCLAQHVDAIESGSYTGFVTLESIKESGAIGSLVNHSEHRMKIAEIDFIIKKAAKLELLTIVCTNNIAVSKSIAELYPYAIAVEPPELIGTGISVSRVNPEVVEGTIKEVKRVDKRSVVLCGAGIMDGKDVKAAIKLGADGVLLASGVVKAKNPETALLDLVSGLC